LGLSSSGTPVQPNGHVDVAFPHIQQEHPTLRRERAAGVLRLNRARRPNDALINSASECAATRSRGGVVAWIDNGIEPLPQLRVKVVEIAERHRSRVDIAKPP